MECRYCHYNRGANIQLKNGIYVANCCDITHIMGKNSCTYITNDEEVEDMDICYNCKYWIGGGDWGLSCQKDYYNCSTSGFNEACEKFERK